MKEKLGSWVSWARALPSRMAIRRRGIRTGRLDPGAGQAYTEYLIILVFSVFLGLGIVVIDRELLPEEVRITDTLYGYLFDYYAGLVNYLNLPCF
jgi:hypothetical protein